MKYLPRLRVDGLPAPRPLIYLETPAVTPPKTYYETPQKLAALFREIRSAVDPELDDFGLCVDTAHLWTSGVDLRTYEAAEAWLAGLEAVANVIPPDRIIFHLNDSARPLGVGPDMHAGLGLGKMWAGVPPESSGLAAFVDYARRHDTVVILERKPKEALASDYYRLRALGAGVAPA
jgi:hypothetical protein